MHRACRSTLLAVLALLLGGLLVGTSGPPATADSYTPAPGVRINTPLGGWQARNRIRWHIIRSIYSVPPGGRIRVMSWNIRDKVLTDALVNVHRYKHVTVQVLMQDDNAYEHPVDAGNPIPAPGDANPQWWQLKWALAHYGNASRPVGRRSWARLCDASCRGGSGLAHIKMVIFSQAGRAPMPVMYSSGNLTRAAADAQWNDLMTIVGNRTLYAFLNARFNELARDRRLANPYAIAGAGGIAIALFPWYGAGAVGDPVLRALRPVACTGAARGYGTATGHTVVRVSQTAITDARGRAIASRLAWLKAHGCNVRVLYSLMGPRVRSILRHGHVRMHQLAVDTDGDWIYDRYLHQKVLVVNGRYGTDPRAALSWNGSANMQGYTLHSDEIFARIRSLGIARYYQGWIDRHFPSSGSGRLAGPVPVDTRSDDVPEGRARAEGIDPYAAISVN